MAPTKTIPIEQFVTALASKQPTPGGGAAAAIAAAIGNAAAAMAAAYTTRKKDIESAYFE
jgi:formiminotetrahydrofolate cyclodeaminase